MKGGKIELRLKEGFTEGALRILDTLHDEAARYIMARSWQHVSVHELRKNIKKIRAILRLVRYETGKEKYQELNDLYRDLAGHAATLRDDTSQIELLESMQQKVDGPGISRTISRAINQVKRKRKEEFQDFHNRDNHIAVHAMILNCREQILNLEINADPESVIMKGLRRTYSRTRKTMKAAAGLKTDEAYHNWRKQVKYLMYQLTVFKIFFPVEMRTYISELGVLSDLLGELHDLNLFNEHIHREEIIVLKPEQKRTMLKYIYRRRAALKKRIAVRGDRLFSESSEAFSKYVLESWLSSRAE